MDTIFMRILLAANIDGPSLTGQQQKGAATILIL
jgi:hypothetical protein